MRGVSTLLFTQDQVRALTGVSVEAVRHWRKAVRYLSAKSGKVARFSFTDVVALSITSNIVHTLGVHIGAVSAGVDSLFRLLGRIDAPALAGTIVLITPTDAIPYPIDDHPRPLSAPALIVPLGPFVANLHNQLTPTALGPMSAVPNPPARLRRRA